MGRHHLAPRRPAGFAVVDLERRLVELHDLDERPGGALVIDLAETHALDP